MSTRVAESTGRLVLTGWVTIILALCAMRVQATDEFYINNGTVNTAPQIDAENFVNYGTFNIFTTLPFETSNTRNYTNYGTLAGSAGFWFDNASPTTSTRRLSDNFVNYNGGVVQSFESGALVGPGAPAPVTPDYLLVHATNIINHGQMSVGANGELRLLGTNINVSRSGLEVRPIEPVGSFNFPPFFLPDVGIRDLFWIQTNITAMFTPSIWDGRSANSFLGISATPPLVADSIVRTNDGFFVTVTNIVGITNVPLPILISNIDATNIVVTNIFFPSNVVRQAVFVGLADTNIQTAAVRYQRSSLFNNPFFTAAVHLTYLSTNVVTDTSQLSDLFFYDTLAAETNRGIYQNFVDGTGRPGNYNLSRIDDGTFFFGLPGNNGVPSSNFLWSINFSNTVADADFAGYEAFVDSLVSRPPTGIPGSDVTNFPGRVRIYGDSLDMRSTRIRGEGEVIIDVNHLVGSSNAVVDCPNLSFNLGSTNGNLHVVNLTKQSVARFQGFFLAWSATWSNAVTEIYANNYTLTNIVDTNNVVIGTNAMQEPITNTVSLGLYAMIVNAANLLGILPVNTYDLVTHSTNVVISDSMTVVQSLLIDGQSLTVNGTLGLGGVLSDWTATNAPNLVNFTNHGSFNVPDEARFGSDRPVPYSTFVNTGSVSATTISINSDYLENRGVLSASGLLTLRDNFARLENGTSSSGDAQLFANTVKMNNYQATARGRLSLSVTNALFDSGGGSSNQISVQDGFTLAIKPAIGDLLGTTIQTIAPNFAEVDHFWAGEERGAASNGYSNNVALGKLVLGPVGRGSPLLFFAGTGAANGLYVDLLDLSNFGTNFANFIQIDPSLTIYYAAAKLGFTPPGLQNAEEYLDGQFGGRLRWVKSFTGPNSSVPVLVNGQTVLMNRGVRFSKLIDSDNDGIPNFYDTTPLGGLSLAATVANAGQGSARSLTISWNAAPNQAYFVEYTSDLVAGPWKRLLTYTNTEPNYRVVSVSDTNLPPAVQRFYRVGYAQ